MSKHFFERLELGYAGEKHPTVVRHYELHDVTCTLDYCHNYRSKYKGIGSQCCEYHQGLMREYGGPGRTDRPWTFHKKKNCDYCDQSPWDHPKVKQIKDELVRDRVAWGMLIVDHIHTQRDGGGHSEENTQTLCLDCNQIKSTLACDTMPKALYNSEQTYYKIKSKLAPILEDLFG